MLEPSVVQLYQDLIEPAKPVMERAIPYTSCQRKQHNSNMADFLLCYVTIFSSTIFYG